MIVLLIICALFAGLLVGMFATPLSINAWLEAFDAKAEQRQKELDLKTLMKAKDVA